VGQGREARPGGGHGRSGTPACSAPAAPPTRWPHPAEQASGLQQHRLCGGGARCHAGAAFPAPFADGGLSARRPHGGSRRQVSQPAGCALRRHSAASRGQRRQGCRHQRCRQHCRTHVTLLRVVHTAAANQHVDGRLQRLRAVSGLQVRWWQVVFSTSHTADSQAAPRVSPCLRTSFPGQAQYPCR
jgi:hypothetical protein